MFQKKRFLPSKRRVWMGATACALFVGLGCVMICRDEAMGWFFVILFGLGMLAPGLLLLPGASWLELDEDGFTICLSFRPDRYSWSHITEMAVWQGVVSFRLSPEHHGRRDQIVARTLSGYDGSIPNMFRLDPQSLLAVMTEYRQHNKDDRVTEQ